MLPRVPTKALASDESLEFEFYLAQKLGMTVSRMRDEMPYDEYVLWSTYYARIAQREELAAQKAKAQRRGK
jgi:hypothetical protein